MKKIFISLLSVFVLGVFFAQTTIAQTPSLSDSSTIAYIHMYEIGIVSQQDRNFVISFNLASIVGAQPQIKYGITVTKASSSDQMIYDEKVYDEVLSLAERESINKTISYVLPASLPADTYRFVIEIKNGGGLSLAASFLADVKISSVAKTENTVEIVTDSCVYGTVDTRVVPTTTATSTATSTYIIGVPVFISTPIVTCKVKSTFPSSVIVTPKFITKIRSSFGDVVPTSGGVVGRITLKKGLNDTSFALPQASKPQKYSLSFSLVSTDGKIVSNSISHDYQIDGAQGTIQNIVFDKTYYKSGDTAKIKIYSTQSSTSTITALVLDGSGVPCAATSSKEVGLSSLINLQILIKKDCLNPKANITLTDINGNILDKNIYQVRTTASDKEQINTNTKTSTPSNIIIILAIIILLIIVIVMMKTKKGKGLKVLLLLTAISFSLIGGVKITLASNFVVAGEHTEGNGCRYNEIGTGGISDLYSHNMSLCGLWKKWNDEITSLYVYNEASTCAYACSDANYGGSCGTFAKTSDTGSITGKSEWYNLNEYNYGVPDDSISSLKAITCPAAPGAIYWSCNADQATISWPKVDYAMGYALTINNDVFNMLGNSKTIDVKPYTDYNMLVKSTYNANRSTYYGALSSGVSLKQFCPGPTIKYKRSLPGSNFVSGGEPVNYGDKVTIKFESGANYSSTGGCDISGNGILSTNTSSTLKERTVQLSISSSRAMYQMTCYGANGRTVSAQNLYIYVVQPPIPDFSAASTTLPSPNTGTILTWDSKKSYQCTIKRDDQSASSIWVDSTINKFYQTPFFVDTPVFSEPSAIALDNSGNLYVADVGTQKIKMFSTVGQTLSALASTFSNLSGISVRENDKLLVSDTVNSKLRVYSSNGSVFSPTPETQNFTRPTGVYYTPDYTYIASADKIYKSDLEYPSDSIYEGTLISSLNLDLKNNLYFTDGDKIKKLSNGSITSWGGTGSLNGQFISPQAITSEFSVNRPNIYVADTGNNRIQKLDVINLKFSTISFDKIFNGPRGITIDPNFIMYVADNGGVYKFEPEISSSTTTGPLSATTTFTIKCNYPGEYGYNGTSTSNSIKISILPAVVSVDAKLDYFHADSYSVLSGSSTVISWSAVNTNSCTLKKDGVALNSTSTSGKISTGPITATSTISIDCVKTDTKTTHAIDSKEISIKKPIDFGPDRHFPPGLTALPSEIVWLSEEGASCLLRKGGENGEIVGEGGSYGSYIQEDLPEGITFVLQCSADGFNLPKATVLSVPPAIRSSCVATQSGNAPEDKNIYVNKNMTWTVSLSGDENPTILEREFSGASIATTTYISSIPNSLNKIYTTVGIKNIKVVTKGKRQDNSDYTSVCSTSTTIKVDPGTGGEI